MAASENEEEIEEEIEVVNEAPAEEEQVEEEEVEAVEVEAEEADVKEVAEPEVQSTTRDEEEGATVDREKRLTGVVTKYMSRQGFGFIDMDDGTSEEEQRLFFHWKAIVTDERWPRISEGTQVEFFLGTQRDGRKFAAHVTTPGGDKLIQQSRDFGEQTRHTGAVKFFDKKKGFGFVESHDDIESFEVKKGDELFVGREEICSDDNPPVLRNGMVVQFFCTRTEKGIHCAEVTDENGEKISIPRERTNFNGRGNYRGGRNRYNNNNNNHGFYPQPPFNYPPQMQLRYKGNITKFNKEKGYGWITPDRQILGLMNKGYGGRQRIYFHVADLEEEREELENQEVSFITYIDRKGTGAASIQYIDETEEEQNTTENTTQPAVEKKVEKDEEEPENNMAMVQQVPPVMHPYDTVTSVVTLQVQNIFIGGLIGRQGKSIRELNRVSGCMIQVLDNKDRRKKVLDVEEDEPLTPHSSRVVSISGYSTNIKKACKLITQKLSEISKNALGRIEFLFDADLTGRIIGKRGANISRLRQKTHPESPLYVTVSKDGLEFRGKQMNSLEIFGPTQDVEKVLERAVDLLIDLQHQDFQEQFTAPADPYNPYGAGGYGYNNGGGNMEYLSRNKGGRQFAQPQYSQKPPTQPAAVNYYNMATHQHAGHHSYI